jgi:FtsP/CotA-like multicopper oxidase with cupredoxin domain
MNRRRLLLPLVASIVMVLTAILPASAMQTPQLPLPGSAIPQFVQPLPLLSVQPGGTINTVLGNEALTVRMCEFDANVLPPGTITPGVQSTTRVWGYIVGSTCPTTPQDTYIGPVIVNDRGEGSTDITWVNNLGTTATTQVLAYKYSTDLTLHWADPANLGGMHNMCNHMSGVPGSGSDCSLNYGEDPSNPGTFTDAPIPAVVHLHGGEVPPELDGGPDAWYTSDGASQGQGYYSFAGANPNEAIYKYPNTQEAGPLWFHDHTLGATRLNVYAGLAGAYYLEDPGLWSTARTTTRGTTGTCAVGCLPDNLQSVGQVIPLVIQDRSFDTTGQLFMPADSAGNLLWTPNPEHPYWVPEFVGDTIVVNGKAWPYLDVQPKRYRFLFLNGSNARTYEMFLINQTNASPAPNLWVIGTDGGYLDAPVGLKKLVMMPGERYEVIIDFANLPIGTNLILKNTAKTPFPAGAAPQGATIGQIMQFRVSQTLAEIDASFDPALGAPLRSGANAIVRLPATATVTRQVTLNEVMGMPQTVNSPVTGALTAYPGGPLEILVNNTKWGGERITGVDAGMYTFEPVPGSTLDNHGNYLTELPQEGTTEVWEIVNLTADAHPIHLHLVQFQIISRQSFNTKSYIAAYNAAFPGGGYDPMTGAACLPKVFCPGYGPPLPIDGSQSNGKLGGNPDVGLVGKNGKPVYLQGKASPANPNEAGWKDTVIAYPGQVTRIAVRWAPTHLAATTLPANAYYPFDPSGGYTADTGFEYGYVWHCHIIDHEDNEMMRPDAVYPNPAAQRTVTDY